MRHDGRNDRKCRFLQVSNKKERKCDFVGKYFIYKVAFNEASNHLLKHVAYVARCTRPPPALHNAVVPCYVILIHLKKIVMHVNSHWFDQIHFRNNDQQRALALVPVTI